jgi:serine/threonine protein kinase
MSETQIANQYYDENIEDIDEFITKTIAPSGVPILEDIDIPQETNNKLPKNEFVTGYISSDGQFAIKNIDYGEKIKNDRSVSMEHVYLFIREIKEALTSELINYHDISQKCPKSFCKLFGYKYNNKTRILTIKMENCGKDLYDYYYIGIKPYPDFSQYEISLPYQESLTFRNHIRQLLNILKCLHDNDYVHFDLKLENIVIDEKGILKLIDAGSLTKINNDNNKSTVIVRGTGKFMAPELREKAAYRNDNLLKATDIYSLGIILIIMIFPKKIGFNTVYAYREYEDIFKLWKYKAMDKEFESINRNFKKIFGNNIQFEHFFSENPGERLTIQKLIDMFEEKTEADRIEYERLEAERIEYERLEAEKEEAERRKAKREEINKKEADSTNTGANNIINNVSGKVKRTYGMGGNKSKKPRRKRNNKSKRRQRKSRSN